MRTRGALLVALASLTCALPRSAGAQEPATPDPAPPDPATPDITFPDPPSLHHDERPLHLRVDTNAVFGIGGQMFLGGRVRVAGYTSVWEARRATGTVDLGLQLLYGNEPVFLAPWLDASQVSGAAHHVQTLVTAGHTIEVGRRRRVGLGLHLVGGWNHWRSSYRVHYPDQDVRGRATVTRNHFIGGGQLQVDVRLARWVGLDFVVGAPLPTRTSYAITMMAVGLGPTFYLR